MDQYGPQTPLARDIHAKKYRATGESFYDAVMRIAAALADNEKHRKQLKKMLLSQAFLPGGRIQASIGSPRRTCAHNCFVSGPIEDDSKVIMRRLDEAWQTMRLGGGIGYDFSELRPKGAPIATLGSRSSGPLPFLEMYDATCACVSSAGHRRGAQMGTLRVDHPDIDEFITAKHDLSRLTNFNLSITITDAFMMAVRSHVRHSVYLVNATELSTL